MITLLLGPADLARTRFAFSPLWECVAAFRAWRCDAPGVARYRWTERFRAVAPRQSWRHLRIVALAPSGMIPDFLAPPPPRPLAEFEEELTGLRATPASVILAELRAAYDGRWPFPSLRWGRERARFLDGVCEELTLFWRWAVAPLWPQLRGLLEAEVTYRSRLLAFGGAGAMFRGLHPAVRFRASGAGGEIRVRTRDRMRRRAGGAGLLLVPSMFAWPEVYVVARPPWRPTLAYPARGVAELSEPGSGGEASDGQTLAALLGVARARVLRRLIEPGTTTDLAAVLGMSPATVSQHVTRLRRAGVLDRTRVGRRVYYAANARGRELLHVLI